MLGWPLNTPWPVSRMFSGERIYMNLEMEILRLALKAVEPRRRKQARILWKLLIRHPKGC